MRRSLAVALFAVTFLAANAFAVVQARIAGKIVDAVTKKPIPNATILVVAAKNAPHSFKQEFKAEKDGSYGIYLLDGTMFYDWTYAAPGYTSFTDTFRLDLSKPNTKDVELTPANATQAATPAPTEEAKVDPSVAAFNEGAALANQGKVPEAIAKIEEAVAAKPDLTAGHQALARLYLRQKDYAKAIDHANKVLAIDNEDGDMYAVLYDAYTATGQKDKAAEVKPKMPANANLMFNDVVPLLNAGKLSEAEPTLKKIIEIDPNYARAYYFLGLSAMGRGDNTQAKENFEKYLALDPNGSDADVAREALKTFK